MRRAERRPPFGPCYSLDQPPPPFPPAPLGEKGVLPQQHTHPWRATWKPRTQQATATVAAAMLHPVGRLGCAASAAKMTALAPQIRQRVMTSEDRKSTRLNS